MPMVRGHPKLLVTTSKALVTSSDALVPSSEHCFLFAFVYEQSLVTRKTQSQPMSRDAVRRWATTCCGSKPRSL